LSAFIKYLFLLAIGCLFLGCNKSGDDLPYSKTPEIRLLSMSHDTITEYRDVLTLQFSYQDGDGDLGFEEPDNYAIFIRDARLTAYDGFYLGPIAPPGIIVPVKGSLSVRFPSLFVFGNRQQESTHFFAYVVDRSGQKSNEIMTPPVLIQKPD
jgi:hypothetical protein